MKVRKNDSYKGVSAAITIISVWLASLIFFITRDFQAIPWYTTALIILWQTFLFTGLFITAHDGMHGIIMPTHKKLNHFLGRLAVFLYALFSYQTLKTKHWDHHRYPASGDDPDFHDGRHRDPFRWYINFIANYITWKQILGMAVVFNILDHLAGLPTINLLLFWVLPALLSTFQLFYFGTYLPHHEAEDPWPDRHHSRSNDYPAWLSFLTCYHFGYHWEHHAFPYVPWWRLPSKRREVSAR